MKNIVISDDNHRDLKILAAQKEKKVFEMWEEIFDFYLKSNKPVENETL